MMVPFAHAIGDHVSIPGAANMPGRVVGLCLRVWGTTYCVIWWQDGKRLEEWLHEWEIVAAAPLVDRDPNLRAVT